MTNFFIDIWSALNDSTKAAIITSVTTLVAALGGVYGIMYQIRSQAKQARDTIKENQSIKLKSEIYEECISTCDELSTTSSKLKSSLSIASINMKNSLDTFHPDLPATIPSPRLIDINIDYKNFMDSVVKLIFLVERRQIIDNRIIIFSYAMNYAIHNIFNTYYYEYFQLAMIIMPAEIPNSNKTHFHHPNVEKIQSLQNITKKLENLISVIDGYLYDFIIEMQNNLLGDIFKCHLPYREPIDPNCKVIRLDHFEELQTYFENETNWGKSNKRLEDELHKDFQKPNKSSFSV